MFDISCISHCNFSFINELLKPFVVNSVIFWQMLKKQTGNLIILNYLYQKKRSKNDNKVYINGYINLQNE